MKHREAVEWLADLACGTVPDAVAASLNQHLGGCRSCREWLETHRQLTDALGSAVQSSELHPDAEVLALCVTRPEEIGEIGRADLQAHLERCSSCRQSIDLVRAAVIAARPSASVESRPRWGSVARATRERLGSGSTWMLLAAAFAAAAIVPAVLLMGRQEPSEVASASSSVRIANQELEGSRLIGGGERTLHVSRVQVIAGAHVRFRAGEKVQFGDGFRIKGGGSMAVEVTRSEPSYSRQ